MSVEFGSVNEWIAELEELAQHTEAADGFMSAAEIATHMNAGRERVLRYLNELNAQGRLEVSSRVTTNLVGRRQHLPVYKVLAPKKPARKRRK